MALISLLKGLFADDARGESALGRLSSAPNRRRAVQDQIEPESEPPQGLVPAAREADHSPAEDLHDVPPELASAMRPFEEWLALYQEADPGSPLERFAAVKAIETAPDKAAETVALFDCPGPLRDDEELRAACMAQLRSSSGSFEEWHDVYRDYDDEEVEHIAVLKMIEAASEFSQFSDATEAIDQGNAEEVAQFTARFAAFTLSEEDRETVIDSYDEDHLMFKVVFDQMLQEADTAVSCLKLYLDTELGDDNNQRVVDKLLSLATPQECEIMLLLAEEGSDLHDRLEE